MKRVCAVDGCERAPKSRGWCNMHYERWRKHGDMSRERKRVGTCSADDCERPHLAKGLCRTHYSRWYKSGDPQVGVPVKEKYSPVCSIDGCEKPHRGRGWCNMHLSRWRRHGDPMTEPPPKTGYRNKWGYVSVSTRDGSVFEHRIVMEGMIGRPLLPGENVHHINGVRDDNRPENLELWVVSQPRGQRVPDLVAWACEILARYAGTDSVLA